VAALLARWGVRPSGLKLEITESTIMADPVRARLVLDELHAMGIGLAIDDFGTGYSSLGYLKQLPVEELKIDRSFVQTMASDRSDATIVQSMIDLGRNLGLRVVAEGVESEAVRGRLEALGCHIGQGYHFSPPIDGDALTAWALARRPRAATLAA
jgi:EAL domain-containing protein (putative c-di-GMP-specific phosphodiesterase class I)